MSITTAATGGAAYQRQVQQQQQQQSAAPAHQQDDNIKGEAQCSCCLTSSRVTAAVARLILRPRLRC
jgi:hypothetical protein